jgi:hypothetical protein
MFGLAHLGYAGSAGLRTFGTDIYTNPGGKPKKPVPKPTVSLTKPPQQCVRRKFQVTATSTGSGVTLTVGVDGHVVRSSRGRRITLTISAGHTKPGRHSIAAAATDRFGRRATAVRQFVRCASD